MSRRWILYLKRCVATSDYKALEVLGANAPFSLDPIVFEIEGGRYVGSILPVPLLELLAVQRLYRGDGNRGGGSVRGGSDGNGGDRSSGGRSSGGGGRVSTVKGKKVGAPGGDARVGV